MRKKEEFIETITKTMRDFDEIEQNEILQSVTTSVIEQRKEVIDNRTKQLKALQESLENIPVLLKV